MKNILTSIIVITFTMPAFATIDSNSTCDTTNLGQSENNATANVEAIWNAKTYRVRYRYNDTDSFVDCSSDMFLGNCNTATYDNDYVFSSPMQFIAPGGYTFNNFSCVDKDNNITTYADGQTITWNIDSDLDCTGQWTANTINIDWYNDGTRIAQNTCTYDSTITLPETPNKTGYTFNGWVLYDVCKSIDSQPTCDSNSNCFWFSSGNKCVNKNAELNGCADASDSDSCAAYGYCIWSDERGCGVSTISRCNAAGRLECSKMLKNTCTWNSDTKKCVIADNSNQ